MPFSSTSSGRSRPSRPSTRRCGSGSGSCGGPATRRSSSSASGVTQAEIEVAKLLPRNGPSGTYSHAWMSRALQSLTSTTPKTWSREGARSAPARRACSARRRRSRARARCRAAATGRRRRVGVGRLCLAVRPADRRAADDDRAGAAVVADRQVAPVRQQRLRVGPEHPAEVRRVLERGVEVDVVGDRERQLRLDLVERESRRPRRSGHRLLGRALPGGAPLRQELVERARAEVDDGVAGAEAEPRAAAADGTCRSPGSQDPELPEVVDRLEEGAAADRDELLAADALELVRAGDAIAPAQRVRLEPDVLRQRGAVARTRTPRSR